MILTRLQFGLAADPWAQAPPLATADAVRVAHLVRAAAESRSLVSIVGPRGSGKTFAVRAACRGLDAAVVEPCRLDRDRLHIGDVVTALVTALSDERPRHGGEARSAQARRLLGRSARPVLLVVDDAHALHAATLRALKRLRELSWRGRSPLLGVVLAGQTDRAGAVPEVGLRTSTLQLAGLARPEAQAAAAAAAGPVCAEGAAERLAASDRARNWLDLERLIDECLAAALARGEAQITAATVGAALGEAAAAPARPAAPAPPPDQAIAAALDAHDALEARRGAA